MRYIEAPDKTLPFKESIFLAGGITGCPDWQKQVTEILLRETYLILFNPRRADFNSGDPSAEAIQIRWEHSRLRLSDLILFWFPAETVCPIALYELGAWASRMKTIFVGCHEEYPRRSDLFHQLQLERPDIVIHNSLHSLVDGVVHFINSRNG